MTKKAIMVKRWGEVGFGSSKRNGWAWEVEHYKNGERVDTRYFNYYTTQGYQAAKACARAWDSNFVIKTMGDENENQL